MKCLENLRENLPCERKIPKVLENVTIGVTWLKNVGIVTADSLQVTLKGGNTEEVLIIVEDLVVIMGALRILGTEAVPPNMCRHTPPPILYLQTPLCIPHLAHPLSPLCILQLIS